MARKTRTYTTQTLDIVKVLGLEVARGRRERRMTADELAERAGTSPMTVRRIERGDPTVAVGTMFEAARLAGVRFFGADRDGIAVLVERGRERLALLPSRVREPAAEIRDDF